MSHSSYLTDTERIKVIKSVMTNHRKQALDIPSLDQYEDLNNPENIKKVAKNLLSHLGYKPRSLEITYKRMQSQTPYEIHGHKIQLNENFNTYPLIVGGILALAVIDYSFRNKSVVVDKKLIEIATIELGLGLWVINSFSPKYSFSETVYNLFKLKWDRVEPGVLTEITTREYIKSFLKYTGEHNLLPNNYRSGLSRRIAYLIPATPSTNKVSTLPEPSINNVHAKNSRLLIVKLLLITPLVALIFSMALYTLWGSRPVDMPKELHSSGEIEQIKHRLNLCQDKLQHQNNSLNHDDLFAIGKIQATQSECQSLYNRYQSLLSDYSSEYSD